MGIKNAAPIKGGRFKQGYYNMENPMKYIGDPTNCIYRSSWELRFMKYCDTNPDVLQWSSEPEDFSIQYFNPIKDKIHKYYPDFFIQLEKNKEEKRNILVEVKPKSQLPEEYGGKKPLFEGERMTLKKMKAYTRAMETYIINKVKFAAAKKFVEEKGWEFAIITEDDLFNKWKTLKKDGNNI